MKPKIHPGLLVGGSALLVLAALAAVWLARLPSPEGLKLSDLSSSTIGITSPVDGGILFLNDPVSVDVEAATKKQVDHFELWVDGILASPVTGEARPSEMFLYSISFPWLGAATGEHILIVRAIGSGWTLDSNAVRVTIIDPDLAFTGRRMLPGAGETLNSLAAAFGLPPMLLALANPQIAGLGDPLSPGEPVLIPDLPAPMQGESPQDPPPGMGADFTPDPAPGSPGRLGTWFDLNLRAKPATPPAAPTLFRWKEGCDLRLYVLDNSSDELGFFVYRLNPGSSSFTRIATLGAHNGAEFFVFTDAGLYGAFDYYVSAFNAAGESASNFSHVVFLDPACRSSDPAVMMVNAIVMKPTQAADKAYCYFSLQEGFWSRFPEDPNAFVLPTENGFDLGRMLRGTALPPQSQLSVECWGWSGGSLLPLGSASGLVSSTPGVVPLGGEGQPLDLVISISKIDWGGFVPVFSPALLNLQVVRITPPYALERTVSLETCANHFSIGDTLTSRKACAEAIATGLNILVWHWDPICSGCKFSDYLPASAIGGFQIFEKNGDDPPHLAATTTTGPWQDVVFLPQGAPTPDMARVYYARAYSGPYVSPRSNLHTWKDLGEGLVSTFAYATVKTEEVKDISGTCSFPDELPSSGIYGDFTVIGYQHLYKPTCGYSDRNYRAHLSFDMGAAKGHVIYNASLVYNQLSGFSTKPGQSCAKSFLTVTGIGSDGTPATTLLKDLPLLGISGATNVVPVTSLVDGWSRGLKPNFGLLMVGRNESLPKTENDSCWTRYGGFMLSMIYFK